MKQNQQFRGLGLVLLVIALIMFASSLTSQGSLFSQEMTHQEFMVAVENKTIESVEINQNQQPPTGTLDILLKSGDRATVAVSDVKDAEKLLQDNSIDYVVENVPQENYLMSHYPGRFERRCDHVHVYVHERESRRGRRRKLQDDEFWKEPREDEPDEFRELLQGRRTRGGEGRTGRDR